MKARFLTLVAALVACSTAQAFDTQTHAYIASQAYTNSNLGNANAAALLQQLGLDRFDAPQPFSPYWLPLPNLLDFYYDNLPNGTSPLQYERPATAYEWQQFQQLATSGALGSNSSSVVGPTPFSPLPIENWLMRGAIREDDLTPDFYDPTDGAPPDVDPFGAILRSLSHFYDPINNQGLVPALPGTCGLSASCTKSVDWALGTTDAFASLAPNTSRRQHFSWEDARQNEFLALIAERDANSDSVRDSTERANDSEERLFRWATTFRALGDVIHLLQDAAQPQHTRNDRHDDHFNPGVRQGFEPFTNYRAIGDAALSGPNPTGGQVFVRGLVSDESKLFSQFLTPLPGISSYPPPSFGTPLRFFTTRAAGDTSSTPPDSRYGMADYSNRGFFTPGTVPGFDSSLPGAFVYPRPDPTLTGFTTQTMPCAFLPQLRSQAVTCTTYFHTVPDPAQSGRSDVTTAQPLLAEGIWKGFLGGTKNQYTLSPQIFQAMGNLTVPRAIAYSAGILNYFFRGNLTVSAPPDKIVAVLNQGAQHTMNAQGYPCVGTATNDGCPIFGFQSVRVSVLNTTLVTPMNTTPTLTETGTNTSVPQNLSATLSGDPHDPNFAGPYLLAVARYHRNTCYKPDLTGERQQAYATPPTTGIITEPTCSAGQVVRTAYQEVSVSKSMAMSAAALNATTAFEVHFDFSADPIPVNATDLFITVVYRGPMGGNGYVEPDAIALGTLDVREPTFAAFWNNTDYFWNGSSWLAHNTTYHNEGVETFWACAGGAPVKMIYEYDGAVGSPAMIDPVVNSGSPGMVRLGIVFPPPDFPAQGKTVQGTPVHYAGDALISINSGGTKGAFRQANMENTPAATLSAPQAGCTSTTVGGASTWCFDPIQKRRGQLFGSPALPIALAPFGGLSSASDVDSVPLPAFAGKVPLATGVIRFDTDATLASCTAQPPSPPFTPEYAAYLKYLETLYEARDLGVSGE